MPGNSFDFPAIHGRSIAAAGYSFASVSDELFEEGTMDLGAFELVDLLAGEERSTSLPKTDSILYRLWTPALLDVLEAYILDGGNLFVSGAHVASDMHQHKQDERMADLLKFRWRTGSASRTGRFYYMEEEFADHTMDFLFNTVIDPEMYTVESADALEPVDTTSRVLIRYRENNMSAGIIYRDDYGVVVTGFPFESIVGQEVRDDFMENILNYLLQNKENGQN